VKLFHLCSTDGTNARVALLRGRSSGRKALKVTAGNQLVVSRTIHRGKSRVDPATIDSQALVAGDPELDLAHVGRIIPETHGAYCRPGSESLEGGFEVILTTYAPDGTAKDRSPYVPRRSNINDDLPVQIGKRLKLTELFQRFVFHGQFYLGHSDGLQYAFLHAIARDLHAAGEAALLGAGPKGNLPLVFTNGAIPTRAFLVGDTDGEKYRLRVLLSRQELRIPDARQRTDNVD
jgi:hypothetical protein